MNPKYILRPILAGFLILAALFIAAILIVRSAQFHRYLLATAVQRAQRALGRSVQIGDFSFRWSGMRMDLYRVAVYGTEPESLPPLFQADHLQIGLKVVSFWKHNIDLMDIVIDHPVSHVSVDRQGRTN